MIGYAYSDEADGTFTWTGIDEDLDEIVISGDWNQSGGSKNFEATQSNITITNDHTGTTSRETMICAAFNPA